MLYILLDDWAIFMISGSNEQLPQEFVYTLLKPECLSWWISKMQSDTSENRYAMNYVLNVEKMSQKRMECFRLLLEHLSWIEHQFLRGIRDSRKVGSLWGMIRCERSKEVNRPELIGQRVRVRVNMLRFYGRSGRDSVGRGQHSSNRVSGISTRTIHQSTTPSFSLSILPRRASRQFLSLPIVETLLPVTFVYSLSSEAVGMRQLRRWKRLWRRSLTRSHKRTSMWPSWFCWEGRKSALKPEEINSKGTRVSCVYYQ